MQKFNDKKFFCFGLGYSAKYLAQQLLKDGWHVIGTCRDIQQKKSLEAEGFEMYIFNGHEPMENAHEILSGVTHLLSSVPTDNITADPVLEYHFDDISDILPLKWVGYLSTTGVYGDRKGAMVDETSPLEPTGQRGCRRVTAEARWMDLWWDNELPVHCFRLASIYGHGKSAIDAVKSLRAKRINKAGQIFSRIHVADIAQILYASMKNPHAGRIYNCCDDNPAPAEEVIAYACEMLGYAPLPLIDFDDSNLSEMAKSFYLDNKLVSNQRIKKELGINLLWPSYKDGLSNIINSIKY